MRKTSPFLMGLMYITMGTLFTYLAIQSAQETIWNFATILFMIIATFDFGVAIRMFALNNKIKKIKKK